MMTRNGKTLKTLPDGAPRRLSDGRNAWRKMSAEQRRTFLAFIAPDIGALATPGATPTGFDRLASDDTTIADLRLVLQACAFELKQTTVEGSRAYFRANLREQVDTILADITCEDDS